MPDPGDPVGEDPVVARPHERAEDPWWDGPGRLLVLTDRAQLPPGRDLVEQVARAVGAGLRWVCLRERDLDGRDRAALAEGLAAVLHAAGGRLCVATPAPPQVPVDGVHLRATDPSGLGAPTPGGRPGEVCWLVGRSCHDAAELGRAAREGADYVTASPYALTRSKPGYGPALGADRLRRMTSGSGAPGRPRPRVLALGGITPALAAEARAAGADGVAVMGEVMRADDPAEVVADLRAALRG